MVDEFDGDDIIYGEEEPEEEGGHDILDLVAKQSKDVENIGVPKNPNDSKVKT